MEVGCQFALYPLRQEKLGEILDEAVHELDRTGVRYRMGNMSTELEGADDEVFRALQNAFRRAAAHGDAVLVATISNACGSYTSHLGPIETGSA